MDRAEVVRKKFSELFSEEPLLVRSPGRINLIGEHTDYNMGFVLPGAIDKAIYFAVAPRNDDQIRLHAVDLNDSVKCTVHDLKKSEKTWSHYLMGVVDQFTKAGYKLRGFHCVFGGDIPIGAGLSSSAAVEAGLAFALNHLFDLHMDKLTLVKLAQKAENEFVGMQCGIMDQYINIFGERDKVLKIDCRSLEYEYVPFEFSTVAIVLFNSVVTHSLASSEYNQRRKECAEGVETIRKKYSHVHSLRDVSVEILQEFKQAVTSTVFRRCSYVVEENIRLLKACSALNSGDVKSLGALMYQTHEGLSRAYEVSCKELDFLVELVNNHPAVYGARMMGGGFGGCTINLVEKDAVDELSKKVLKEYKRKFNIEAKSYVTFISSGTNIISADTYARS